jgi:hypothetical protein
MPQPTIAIQARHPGSRQRNPSVGYNVGHRACRMSDLTPEQERARSLMTPATYARLAPAEPQRVGDMAEPVRRSSYRNLLDAVQAAEAAAALDESARAHQALAPDIAAAYRTGARLLREKAKELRVSAQDTRTNIVSRAQEIAARAEVREWFQRFVDANPSSRIRGFFGSAPVGDQRVGRKGLHYRG